MRSTQLNETLEEHKNEIPHSRRKRSPVSSQHITTPMPTQPPTTIVTIIEQTPIPEAKVLPKTSKMSIGETLGNYSAHMNVTLSRLKATIKGLPTSLNLTSANFGSFISAPFDILTDSFQYIAGLMKSLSFGFGILSTVLMFVIMMPLIEIIILGLKIAKVPANMWLGSFRRVRTKISHLPNLVTYGNSLSKTKRKWDTVIKRA